MATVLIQNLQNLKFSARKFSLSVRNFRCRLRQSLHSYSGIPVWSCNVNNFGDLHVLSGNIGVHVVSLETWSAGQSAVTVSLVSGFENLLASSETLRSIRDCVSFDISTKEDNFSQVRVEADTNKLLQRFKPSLLDNMKLLIKIPHSYSLLLNSSSEAPVTVEKLEGNAIKVLTHGNCYLSQIKSPSITVNSVAGDIISQSSLIGNLSLMCDQSGCVSLRKIQGNEMKIKCRDGDVRIGSLYGGDVVVDTQAGNVDIGDAHGNIEANSKSGDLICGSMSGQLKAVTVGGNIDTKLTSSGSLIATSLDGNATIKLDADVKYELNLSSKTFNIGSDVDVFGEFEQSVDGLATFAGQTQGNGEQFATVNCSNGHIDLLQESWFVLPGN